VTSSKHIAAFCTLFLLAAAPTVAFAQRTPQDIETARRLYNEGVELRDKGDWKGALEKFKAAHALGNTPITGVELCKTHATLNQPVEAREVCLGVARIPPLSGETQRSVDARNEAGKVAEEQKPKIGSIRIKLQGVPAGREPTVTVDGVSVPPAALGQPRSVNPGVHVVSAKVGKGAETRATLETKDGENRELDLTVQPPPPDDTGPGPGPGPGPQPGEKKGNALATGAFITGGIAIGIGAIAGLVAIAGKSSLEDKCKPQDSQPGRPNACGKEQWDELDTAKTWGNVSTAFFIIGGIAGGIGLVAVLTAPKSSSGSNSAPTKTSWKSNATVKAVVGPTGAGLYGSF
jgi:hypothetical protein